MILRENIDVNLMKPCDEEEMNTGGRGGVREGRGPFCVTPGCKSRRPEKGGME